MARKLIPAEKKWASVLRVLQEGRTVDEERRRLGVATQTFHRFINAYLKKYPAADKRVKATAPPPPPPSSAAPSEYDALARSLGAPVVTVEDVDKAEAEAAPIPKDSTGLIDTAALKAAMEADGGLGKSPAPGGAPPPAPGMISLSTEKDDMEVVEGISNQLMGHSCRFMLVFFEMRSGVRLPEESRRRIQELYVLTSTERAMLKPASAHLARKIREMIGSSENVALTVGGSTLVGGLFDRFRIVGDSIAREFEIQRPDLKAAAAEKAKEEAAAKGATA